MKAMIWIVGVVVGFIIWFNLCWWIINGLFDFFEELGRHSKKSHEGVWFLPSFRHPRRF